MPTGISWTDETWNPMRGCQRVSAGCENCYAEQTAGRFMGKGMPYEGLVKITRGGDRRWTGKGRFVPEQLTLPLTWRTSKLVFVDSMSDLFYEKFTNEEIAAVFGIMACAQRHTFQILTKRPERMRDWFAWVAEEAALEHPEVTHLGNDGRIWIYCWQAATKAHPLIAASAWAGEFDQVYPYAEWPMRNVWLGVSVENQETADSRIPWLLETPAALRFLSCEPLLEQIDITEYLDPAAAPCGETTAVIDWVIAGAESGKDKRLCEHAWLASLRDQCAKYGQDYYLKQAVVGTLRQPDGQSSRIRIGKCSKKKPGNVVERPYLDGMMYAEMPAVATGEPAAIRRPR
jgi:protein gp37